MKINEKFTQVDEVSQDLLELFLEPYKENCKYLKKAQFQYPELGKDVKSSRKDNSDLGVIKGEFSIPDSCYIDDTGHFNSVEFNICYNQLSYVLMAYLIQNKLLKVMKDWDLESYKHRQLSDFLIVKFSSTFKRPIDSDRFEGTLSINKQSARKNLIMLKTSCSFFDHNGGFSEGDVTIAVLNNKQEKSIDNRREEVVLA